MMKYSLHCHLHTLLCGLICATLWIEPAVGQVPSFEHVYDGPTIHPSIPPPQGAGYRGVSEIRYCGADGGYIAVGKSLQPGGSMPIPPYIVNPYERALITRTTNAGAPLWVKTYDIGGTYTLGQSIKELPDGTGFIVTGTTDAAGTSDIFLMKIDCDGIPVWTRTYERGLMEKAYDVIIAQSYTLGNPYDFVIAGQAYSAATSLDAYLVRTDATGTILWERAYDYLTTSGSTAGEFLALTEAVPTSTLGGSTQVAGDIVAVGSVWITSSQQQAYMVRVDGTTGNFRASNDPLFNGLQNTALYGSNDEDSFYSVIQLVNGAEAGNIVAIGRSFNAQQGEIFLVKNNGDPCQPIVQQLIGSALASILDGGYDVKELANAYPGFGAGVGDLIITGTTRVAAPSALGDIFMLAVDVGTLAPINGTGKLYGDLGVCNVKDEGSSITEVIPSGGNTAGFAMCGTSGAPRDLYLVKTDANGQTGCETTWTPQSNDPGWPIICRTYSPFALNPQRVSRNTTEEDGVDATECPRPSCPAAKPLNGNGSEDEIDEEDSFLDLSLLNPVGRE